MILGRTESSVSRFITRCCKKEVISHQFFSLDRTTERMSGTFSTTMAYSILACIASKYTIQRLASQQGGFLAFSASPSFTSPLFEAGSTGATHSEQPVATAMATLAAF